MGAIISLCLILHLIMSSSPHSVWWWVCLCAWERWSQTKAPRGENEVQVSGMCVDATIWPYAACIACVHLCYDCITDCQLALVAQVRKAQSCFIPPPNPHTYPKQLAHKHTQLLVNCRRAPLLISRLMKNLPLLKCQQWPVITACHWNVHLSLYSTQLHC